MRREDFLLASEIQIQGKGKFVPRVLAPREFSVFRKQPGKRIDFAASSVCDEVKIRAAVVISRRALQRVTDSSSKSQQPNRRRRTVSKRSQNQMQINAHKNQMVGQAVNDAAFAAFPTRQTRKRTIRVVERI